MRQKRRKRKKVTLKDLTQLKNKKGGIEVTRTDDEVGTLRTWTEKD